MAGGDQGWMASRAVSRDRRHRNSGWATARHVCATPIARARRPPIFRNAIVLSVNACSIWRIPPTRADHTNSCGDRMATADVIQLEALLAPIPGDKPTGLDLRADHNRGADYFKLKDAGFAARAKEREVDPGAKAGDLPEWRTILDLAPKLLATQTKDLEIAAWLVEALLRRRGPAGL